MKLLHELRRRQMFRLTGLYIVGAWLVIQVADIAFPSWGIPDSAMRFLFYAALLCFPIALVVGWYFDIRADGVYRTRKAGPDEIVETKMRWQDYAILAGLAGVGITILLGSIERIRVETEMDPVEETVALVERRENSVAVLPFDNLDPDPETGFFSDGVSDEILSRLANRRGLFVVGRASSFAFRNSEENPAIVSAKLGVQYLLSGSVRRDGDMVRVTARLIDQDGAHVWSQSFDRKLEKTLVIQSEIANEVASRIVSEVSSPESTSARSSVVPEAYSSYLLGKKLFQERSLNWHVDAPRLFREAIDADPEFAPAYAYLAILSLIFPESLVLDEEDKYAESEAAIKTAMELDPNLAEGYFALALLHERRDNDTEGGINLLRQALDIDPTLSTAQNLLGNFLVRAGYEEEARAVYKQGLARDPLNPVLIVNVAWDHISRGEYERGEQLMLRMTLLPQNPQFMHHHLKLMYWQLGRLDQYIRWSKDGFRYIALSADKSDPVIGDWPVIAVDWLGDLGNAYLKLGMQERGYRLLDLAAKEHPTGSGRLHWQAESIWWRGDIEGMRKLLSNPAIPQEPSDTSDPGTLAETGLAYAFTGNHNKAIGFLAAAFATGSLSDLLVGAFPFGAFHNLAFAHKAIGNFDKAEELAEKGKAILTNWDKFLSATLLQIALNNWLCGDTEAAINSFRQAIDAGWVEIELAEHDPMLRAFLGIADFRKEIARIDDRLATQRAAVAAADAEDDFDVFVRQFMGGIEPRTEPGQ